MSGSHTRRSPGATGLRDRTDNTSVYAANHITDTNTGAQRQRLLTRLRHQSITTVDARRMLNIFHPAMRVKELRNAGHHIVTRLIDVRDDQGRPHCRVALYSLISEGDA